MLSFTQFITEKVGGITAWHGSPANFDKFNRSKAHSGEGGAAVGSGIYITQSPEVAKYYQKLSNSDTSTLYKLKVIIDTDKIVRWDLPISRQPKPVQDVLNSIEHNLGSDPLARHVYHSLRAGFGSGGRSGPIESEKATNYLEDKGLHGIYFVGDKKYKGPAREKAKNYVIFDPNRITILQKFNSKGKEIK